MECQPTGMSNWETLWSLSASRVRHSGTETKQLATLEMY